MLYSKAGAALEGLVAQHLRVWIAIPGMSQVYITAVEVKSSSRFERGDVRSLCTFQEDYLEAQSMSALAGLRCSTSPDLAISRR